MHACMALLFDDQICIHIGLKVVVILMSDFRVIETCFNLIIPLTDNELFSGVSCRFH